MDPFFIAAVVVAIIGTAYASYSDLKTTEVSDWVPLTMAICGLVINGVHSLVTWDYTYVTWSLAIGLIYLAYGALTYKLGQWGGADAALLSALGFLIPIYPGFSYFGLPIPYQIAFVLNIYVLGAIYSFFYAIVLAFRNKKVFPLFMKDLKGNAGKISVYFAGLCVILVGLSGLGSYLVRDIQFFYETILKQMVLFPLFLFLLFYWRFAKIIESHVFKWKIPSSKLKVGDMVADDIVLPTQTIKSIYLEGLTKQQVALIKKHKKYVRIKEGIRFIPAFLFGLIFTLLMKFIS